MKKNLLLIFVATFILGIATASAQVCTPDPQYTVGGVYPDSATGLADAGVGIAYGETVTIVTPVDTTVEIIPGVFQTLTMDSIVITNVTGLPPGFTYDCASAGCAFIGGTTSCLIISGTAVIGDLGNHPLSVEIDAFVGGTGIPVPSSVGYYSIQVIDDLATGELNGDQFEVLQNTPNPFDAATNINFNAAASGAFTFQVINLLGAVVHQEQVNGKRGENTFTFASNDLNQGVYLYSLSNGNYTVTKRMVVNR
jgi:hypothetical protein